MQENPIKQLVHSTVRIECDMGNGQTSTGSGYFYNFFENEDKYIPCIVTNKHVVSGAKEATIHLTIDVNEKPQLGTMRPIIIPNFEQECIFHEDPDVDLVIYILSDVIKSADNEKYHMLALTKSMTASKELLESLSPMEDIIMIGYPNGIWDSKHNLPIIRRGITATHPSLDYNGKPEFVIDAACFPGSSGSPVFLANIGTFTDPKGKLCAGNRIIFLGTLYAGPIRKATGEIEIINVPTDTKALAITDIMINLGFIIHANKLSDFEPKLRKYL